MLFVSSRVKMRQQNESECARSAEEGCCDSEGAPTSSQTQLLGPQPSSLFVFISWSSLKPLPPFLLACHACTQMCVQFIFGERKSKSTGRERGQMVWTREKKQSDMSGGGERFLKRHNVFNFSAPPTFCSVCLTSSGFHSFISLDQNHQSSPDTANSFVSSFVSLNAQKLKEKE